MMFKGMMLKRNMELEKEAINALNKAKNSQNNLIKHSKFTGTSAQGRADSEIRKEIIKISKMDE